MKKKIFYLWMLLLMLVGGVNDAWADTFSGTYPYTWDLTSWQKSDFTGFTRDKGEGYYSNNGEISQSKDALTIQSPNNVDRIFINSTTGYPVKFRESYIITPSLKKGIRIILELDHQMIGSITASNTESSSPTSLGYNQYQWVVSSEGTVSIHFPAPSNYGTNNVKNVKVEKADFTFSENTTTFWDGSTTTTTKSASYLYGNSDKFSVGANVPAGVSITSSDFTVTSSNTSVIDVSSWQYNNSELSSGRIWFSNLIAGNAGTAVVTFTYKGNETYAAKSFSVAFNISKANPKFKFNVHDGVTGKSYSSEETFSKTWTEKESDITIATDGETESQQEAHNITFTSSDTHVATVDQYTGIITVHNSGSTTIRAKFAGNSNYNAAETWTYLVVTGSTTTSETLSWYDTPDVADLVDPGESVNKRMDDNDFQYDAIASGSSTVKYKSSNIDVATVDAYGNVHLIRPGEVYINAYIDGSGDVNGRELKYYIYVSGGEISISFDPVSGTVSPGCVIMPRLDIPTIEKDNIDLLEITSSNTSVATVPNLNLLTQSESLTMQGTRIDAIHPIINGVANGEATITVRFQSKYYNNNSALTATFNVTVKSDQTDVTWKMSKREYTITTGEYMMMPTIEGNFNGNINGLSKGSVCEIKHGYVYSILGSSRTKTWNNKNYYLGEGVPDYTLVPANVGGGEGYIYWCSGEDADHPSLMIYGESAGDLILRATDSQTGYSPGDITIHVVDKTAKITDVNDNFWSDKKFPFTWDFTKIRPADVIDDDVHWRKYSFGDTANPYQTVARTGEHFLGMPASFNYDYSDEDLNGKGYQQSNYQMLKKYITNGEGENCKIMPAFYGLRLDLGNNASGSYWSKRDKVALYDTNDSDPRLYIEGGEHRLYLPSMPSDRRPSAAYRVYLKVKGHNAKSSVALFFSGENDDNFIYSGEKKICPTAGGTIYFDISTANAGKKVGFGFENNLDLYWIALSTEAKPVYQPTSTTYPASTYSYTKALDLDKSAEVNTGLTTCYASGFNSSTNSVTMTSLTGRVEANSGLMLKLPATNKTDDDTPSSSCYMIADPENSESYSVPTTLNNVPNYLIATGNTPATPERFTSEGSDAHAYTNFILTNTYHKILDNTEKDEVTSISDAITDDWKYVRTAGDIEVGANKAYLRLPGRLLNINASARAMSESTADSRTVLNIVFDDEQDVTGIQSLHTASNAGSDDDGWHTLQGVKVSTPTRGGLYIYKGKKIAVK